MPIVMPGRAAIAESYVRSGSPVSAATWRAAAALDNWTLGSGGVLVAGHSPDVTLSAGVEYVLKYRAKTRYQALQRAWYVSMRTSTGSTQVEVTPSAAGSTSTVLVGAGTEGALQHRFLETLSAQSATEAELQIAIKPLTADIQLDSIACHEVPRADLVEASSNDLGHSDVAFNPREKIVQARLNPAVVALADAGLIGTRPALISWAVPVTAGGSKTVAFARSTASTTAQDLWALPIPILARKLARGATTADVTVKILAWVSAGTGAVGFTTTNSGAADEATFTNTDPAWVDVATNERVDCEDMASADGRQGAAFPVWDDLQVTLRHTTAGTVYVAGVWIGEG